MADLSFTISVPFGNGISKFSGHLIASDKRWCFSDDLEAKETVRLYQRLFK